ncbi:hypothetical protein SERLA73DRAFT_191333 [Serpula lacrymans var. lacrymans S7.3]|uniref:4'-phosphopantetheinyl transferase domain-containing protein n=2 Tax=Serpula lacrymans var. lacrymans TaxID=341189 RepID=F8QHB4_SERL3|nr:uncharacterized protein SERLADRAFT_477668 [Serpula lacrymans var. lacrymans S7.9]EGN92297.1 hypothetical protein SERLA73DRAFT_191333 [Serpula lacrymans var. lacrymans S7.3]EGO20262.1 hypothetical protein SERLADRAFT_477668 [Serpula lacrymans var. lacrymans S7.9]
MDCPLLVWMLSLNRDITKEEYDKCFELVRECAPHTRIPYAPTSMDSFRQVINQMLPLLMMRHRRISRTKWKDCETPTGKHWIEQSPDDMPPEKFLQSMIGYHLAYENSLCGMVMTQGRQRQVINIGLGIKQIAVEPAGATVAAYAESFAHKLTPLEMTFISPEQGEDVVLRRLCILLALKAAYIKAVGQPIGFDWSRLEFNIPNESARGDDHPLQGWEFRVFKAQLGVVRRGILVEESYQCACAFFRGSKESKFIWHDNTKDLEAWVQFINIDQMVKVIPKLTA